MAEVVTRNESLLYARTTNWGAIWAGVFSFAAIWLVFGVLGEAIFASSANPNAANQVTGMNVGEGIWVIVLTIIAMYVAGWVTGHLADYADRNVRIFHGMAMFGLSVVATMVIVILSGTALSGGTGLAAGAHSSYMFTVFADVGWIGFAALFLGWLSALGGAAHGAVRQASPGSNVRDIRPAA